MSQGVLGTTGDLSGQRLLDSLRGLHCDGTLVFTQGSGALLLQLARGQVEATVKLGGYGSLEQAQQAFHLFPHEPGDTPRLPSRFPDSASPLLRALPRLAPPMRMAGGLVDLRALLDQLHRRAFNGVLSLTGDGEVAAAVLLQGRIAAAAAQRANHVASHADAMRALQRASLDEGGVPLELEPLDPALIRGLLGLALGRPAGATEPSSFTGVTADGRGVRFQRNGQAYLQVDGPATTPPVRYAALTDEAASPDLHLPDEPPGWEQQRYALTLRGQDALNPMTELAMHFRSGFGSVGHRALETLGRGLTLEQAAEALGLELQEFKPWLERLEGDGLIRPATP